jgi:hypothetical protein
VAEPEASEDAETDPMIAAGPTPAGPPAPDSREADPMVAAARRVLELDGRAFVLQPWQAGYLIALVEGRQPVVPPNCGAGRGWLDARLREAIESTTG